LQPLEPEVGVLDAEVAGPLQRGVGQRPQGQVGERRVHAHTGSSCVGAPSAIRFVVPAAPRHSTPLRCAT